MPVFTLDVKLFNALFYLFGFVALVYTRNENVFLYFNRNLNWTIAISY
jgi:hypothetical protein